MKVRCGQSMVGDSFGSTAQQKTIACYRVGQQPIVQVVDCFGASPRLWNVSRMISRFDPCVSRLFKNRTTGTQVKLVVVWIFRVQDVVNRSFGVIRSPDTFG